MSKARRKADANDRSKLVTSEQDVTESKNTIRGMSDVMAMKDTPFDDGRYGKCQSCGDPIVIPGLARYLCVRCGWVRRRADTETIGPRSHHE